MNNFLSNDRKVILKSAATGVGIIFLLSLVLLTNSAILWVLAFLGVLAVYWCIPTWFSSARQLKKIGTKYFNADIEEVRTLSAKEQVISFILFIIISIILVLFVYDSLAKYLIIHYPFYKVIIKGLAVFFSFSTPFLIRHTYCFILNHPMDTSLVFENKTGGAAYIHNFDDRRSQSYNFATNPIYSYMPSNQYHYRNK